MKYIIVICLFIPQIIFCQNADWKELQAKIDGAIKNSGIVKLERDYTIDKPLVAARWVGTDYGFFSFQLLGNATIKALFNDAPALSIHKAKGVIIRDITFIGQFKSPRLNDRAFYNSSLNDYSNGGCRNSRYSPYAAIAIDPFMYQVPPDGGYPGLKSFYKGKKSVSGSTGIRFENCSFTGFLIGAITSPNGYTLNAEIITFDNITISNCKIGFSGNQAQEKMNRIINLTVNGPVHTVFLSGFYGQGHPGNWIIDGANLVGRVCNLVNRITGKYFPMYVHNVKSDALGSIGIWQSSLSDALTNSDLVIVGPEIRGNLPDALLQKGRISLINTQLRYKNKSFPMIIPGKWAQESTIINKKGGSDIIIWQDFNKNKPLRFKTAFKKENIKNNLLVLPGKALKGELVFFYAGNFEYQGCGLVESASDVNFTVGLLSPGVYTGKANMAAILK